MSGSDEENRVSGIKWKVGLIDESGKIPLNHVSDKNLQSLFAAMVNDNEGGGLFDEDDGRPFLECLRDWEDEDDEDREDGAEDDFYEDLVRDILHLGEKCLPLMNLR